MTTLVLLVLAGIVVTWVAHRARATDTRDETERFAQLQDLVGGWTEEARGSRSGNDLEHSA